MSPAVDAPLLHLLDEPALRAVPGGVGPYPGDVVSWDGRPATRVAADAEEVASLWNASGEHVADVREILRTVDGHAVVVPQCARTLSALAESRAAVDDPLRPGEVVTLAVSVLRGTIAEQTSHDDGESCHGEWWLDDEGTPLFVHSDGGAAPHASAIRAIRAVQATATDDGRTGRTLDGMCDALADPPRLAARAAECERDLFSLAPPEAIGMRVLTAHQRTEREAEAASASRERTAWERLADASDAGIAEMASQALTGAWRALRSRSGRRSASSRRGVLLAAVACAALVFAVGLLWPTGDAQTDVASSPSAESPTPPLPAADGAETAPEQDAISATAELLDRLSACGADAACQHPLFDADAAAIRDGGAFVTEGATRADPAARELTLLDDVGGLVLLRADDATGARPSQVVAVLRQNEKWVLRDIHDVAQHPG